MKHKLKSRLLGEVSIASDMQMIHPYGRKQRGTKEPPCSKLLPLGLSLLAHLVSNCIELCLVLSLFFDASPSLMGWEALL